MTAMGRALVVAVGLLVGWAGSARGRSVLWEESTTQHGPMVISEVEKEGALVRELEVQGSPLDPITVSALVRPDGTLDASAVVPGVPSNVTSATHKSLCGALAWFSTPISSLLVVGLSSGLQLPLVLSAAFRGTQVDVVEDDVPLRTAVSQYFGLGDVPTQQASARLLMHDMTTRLSRYRVYSAVLYTDPCDSLDSDQVLSSIGRSMSATGVLAFHAPTGSSCISAVVQRAFNLTSQGYHVFKRVYTLTPHKMHDVYAEVNTTDVIILDQNPLGTLNYYTVFNQAVAITSTHGLPFPLQSTDIITPGFNVTANPRYTKSEHQRLCAEHQRNMQTTATESPDGETLFPPMP